MNIFGKTFNRPKWVPKWLNIPLVVFIVFIASLLFLNKEYNFMNIIKYKKEIKALKAGIKANEDSAMSYEKKVQELNTDLASQERVVRENYGMKRLNEEVYITNIP